MKLKFSVEFESNGSKIWTFVEIVAVIVDFSKLTIVLVKVVSFIVIKSLFFIRIPIFI